MRWSDYVAHLPRESHDRLVDGILGLRHLQDALAGARAGARPVAVLGALGVAYGALRDAVRILGPGDEPADEGAASYGPGTGDRPLPPWSPAVRALLASADGEVRAALDAAAADAEVARVRAHLAAALAALRSLRQPAPTE